MPKRLLNMSASDFAATSPMDLKQAILASEGRTIMAENVPSSQFLGGVTNAGHLGEASMRKAHWRQSGAS